MKASFSMFGVLLLSFDKQSEYYHWWADVNESSLTSLLCMSVLGSDLMQLTHCGFYDREKCLFFQTKFKEFLSNNNIQLPNKFCKEQQV